MESKKEKQMCTANFSCVQTKSSLLSKQPPQRIILNINKVFFYLHSFIILETRISIKRISIQTAKISWLSALLWKFSLILCLFNSICLYTADLWRTISAGSYICTSPSLQLFRDYFKFLCDKNNFILLDHCVFNFSLN